MKNNILSFVVGCVLMFILIKSCESKWVPEPKTGTFTQIENIYHTDTITITDFKPVYRDKIKTIIKEVENIKIMYDTANVYVKDSICNELLTLRKFETTFENKDVHAVVSGMVQGHVKAINFDYLIKPEPTPKEKHFSLYGGFGADFNASMPVIRAGIGYKNYEIDYLKINNINYFNLGYRFRF